MLFLEPTGYKAAMTCFVYDDLETWRHIYPVDVFESQWEKLCKKWEDGLVVLKEQKEPGEMEIMAQAAYCLFRASLNQVRFYRARANGDREGMIDAAEAEIICAGKMLQLMNQNASIGFEAANHYYFSKGCLREKILNCNDIVNRLKEG